MPCGILNPKAKCVIGNGCVIHIPTVLEEIKTLKSKGVNADGRLYISDRAHVLLDLHKEVDGLREQELADKKLGTTKRGIGPCYSSKGKIKLSPFQLLPTSSLIGDCESKT